MVCKYKHLKYQLTSQSKMIKYTNINININFKTIQNGNNLFEKIV